jgi:hypothetical protein
LNFPLLFFASQALERHAGAHGLAEVLFVSRDCLMWQKLYQALFPHRRSTYLFTSRRCLFQPSASYLEYFRSQWGPRSVIVDLMSTGISWSKFFARLGAKGRFFFIGRLDDCAYVKDPVRPDDWMEMTTVFRNSELSKPSTKAVEMLNYAPHPLVEDVLLLPGNEPLPILAQSLEYDAALPTAAHRSFLACVQALEHYPKLAQARTEPVTEIIKSLVGFICADPHLGGIYAGHQALDEAYMRRVLAAAAGADGATEVKAERSAEQVRTRP